MGARVTQDAVLRAARDGGVVSVGAIAGAIRGPRKNVAKAALKLVDRGYFFRVGVGVYRITGAGRSWLETGKSIKSGPVKQSPKTRTRRDGFRERFWRALMVREKAATVEELLERSLDGSEKNPKDNAYRYLRALEATGFVVRMSIKVKGDTPTSNGFDRFLLMRRTGHRAPIWRSSKNIVHDPNTGKDYPVPAPGDKQ